MIYRTVLLVRGTLFRAEREIAQLNFRQIATGLSGAIRRFNSGARVGRIGVKKSLAG